MVVTKCVECDRVLKGEHSRLRGVCALCDTNENMEYGKPSTTARGHTPLVLKKVCLREHISITKKNYCGHKSCDNESAKCGQILNRVGAR